MADNFANGIYPAADISHNVPCERTAFGMGPEDRQWHMEKAYLHVATEPCPEQLACPRCELVLLRECNGRSPDVMTFPDTWYIFEEESIPIETYTQPKYLAKSLIPDFSNRFNPNAKNPQTGWLTTAAVSTAGNAHQES